ncbi:hypothetical protein SAMN05216215_10812 [Saccharopolyspora shandongensis]|uniref:Uncharacterized protein n=1 Tax=Saccharopolyspora shandongensis TaxID=418495 RepID=A0A1H3TDY7_9PSEU|nr:hypothetical protein SAMN05216215_10812 [Saccharopolyspora shandongensis]
MRLSTLRLPSGTTGDRTTAAAVLSREGWMVLPHADVGELLRSRDGLQQARQELEWPSPRAQVVPLEQSDHAPVVTTARKIVCCGHNYRAQDVGSWR